MLCIVVTTVYSRKFWRGIKFGGLAVYNIIIITIAKLKFAKISYWHNNADGSDRRLLSSIPYLTTKFKSANILSIAILGSTAKFNSCQYFRLYGTLRGQLIQNIHNGATRTLEMLVRPLLTMLGTSVCMRL